MARRQCPKHPNYRGLRKPRAKKNGGEPCPMCLEVYESVFGQGVREKKQPYRRRKHKTNIEPIQEAHQNVTPAEILEEEPEEEVAEAADLSGYLMGVDEAVEASLKDNGNEKEQNQEDDEEEGCDDCSDNEELEKLKNETIEDLIAKEGWDLEEEGDSKLDFGDDESEEEEDDEEDEEA